MIEARKRGYVRLDQVLGSVVVHFGGRFDRVIAVLAAA